MLQLIDRQRQNAVQRLHEGEDDWLRGVLEFLQRIIEDPGVYVDYWNLEEEEGVTATMIKEIASELYRRAEEALTKPQSQRGKQGWGDLKMSLGFGP